MNWLQCQAQVSVFHRILWLGGLNGILSNTFYLVGYYLLPEGIMRSSPTAVPSKLVAEAVSFWPQFGLTLLFNLGVVGVLAVLCNLNTVRGFPTGYLIPIVLGITGGLVAGTNSFLASDLRRYSAREGTAQGLSIGWLETLGFILIIASTVKYGVYEYRSWWRWSSEWKPIKRSSLRSVQLSLEEVACLAVGVLLLVFTAYRETTMALGR